MHLLLMKETPGAGGAGDEGGWQSSPPGPRVPPERASLNFPSVPSVKPTDRPSNIRESHGPPVCLNPRNIPL